MVISSEAAKATHVVAFAALVSIDNKEGVYEETVDL